MELVSVPLFSPLPGRLDELRQVPQHQGSYDHMEMSWICLTKFQKLT